MLYRLKRTFSIIVVLSMLTTMLAACGGGEATPTATTAATGGAAGGITGGAAGEATATPSTGGAAGGEATATPATGGAGVGATDATATPATSGGAAGGGAAMGLPEGCSAVELSYWNPFTGPDGPFMGKLTDKFNSENKNIKVTMTTQADYYTQIQTAAASDTLPDVAIIHADQVATWAFRNVLRPIDDLVSQMGLSASDYPAGVWKPGEIAGKRYSIPLDIHPFTVLYYNEDLLKDAGITAPPTNKAEFEKAAQAVTDKGKKGFEITAGFPIMQIFLMILVQNGGAPFNEDGTKVTWNSDEGVKALQWMKDAQSKWSDPNLEVDAELAAFKAGNAGMIFNGIWQIPSVTGSAVQFAGKGFAPPQLGDKINAAWAGSHQLTLPVHKSGADKCKDAAGAMFIKYIVDNSVEWAKAGQIPANNKVRNSAEFKAIQPQASIAPSVENAVFPPAVPGIVDTMAPGPLEEGVSSVMSGKSTDVKKALDDAASRAEQILAENKSKYGAAPKSP